MYISEKNTFKNIFMSTINIKKKVDPKNDLYEGPGFRLKNIFPCLVYSESLSTLSICFNGN